MAFHIRDEETDTLVRELARRKGVGLTEAVKLAVRNQLNTEKPEESLHEKLKKIADSIAEYPKTGRKADKAFFDDLSGN
jgi:antitoxin VapB